jgi:hypothetical protein
VTKKTLQQLVESTKHSFIARIIIASNKIILEKTHDDYSFIACVKKLHKTECINLSRRGRDSLTSIIVYEVWDKQEAIAYFSKSNKSTPSELSTLLESGNTDYCFCRCNIKIQKAEIRGPSR